VQARYAQQINLFTHAISKYFPPETRVTQPQGGFVLWVELPQGVDTLKLCHRMLKHKVSIAPGPIFSATQKYRNCIRLNCAQPWSVPLEKALILMGKTNNIE
jgi:DNA-binding transcriptional MocR family regulator